jgi:Zn-dependent protease with chaperone function
MRSKKPSRRRRSTSEPVRSHVRLSQPIAKTANAGVQDPTLTAKVDQYLRRLGCTTPAVVVMVTTDGLATAAGITMFGVSFGQISVSKSLLATLSADPEALDFVLAHEVAHIWESHLVAKGAFAIARAMLDQEAKTDPVLLTMLAAWDVAKVVLFAGGNLPIDAALTKEQELDADALAARLVGSVDAGHRALLTLVGGNRSAPSHTWEVFQTAAPVMTVGERLAALDARFGILRWPRSGG